MPLHDDAIAVLGAWEPLQLDPRDRQAQAVLRDSYLAFLHQQPDGMWRECRVGHLTASALVLRESTNQALLTLHPIVGRWLQLGGHCEPTDATLVEAAAREAREESGIAGVSIEPVPVRLDRHEVRCAGLPTWHLDVQYLALVPDDAVARISAESDDLQWWSVDEPPASVDASVQALWRDAVRLRA